MELEQEIDNEKSEKLEFESNKKESEIEVYHYRIDSQI